MDSPRLGIYIHIPFCKNKCSYCAFDSFRHRDDRMAAYVAALRMEIDRHSSNRRGIPVVSVFFGGGTPSLLTPAQARDILGSLRKSGVALDGTEITMEANPGTVTRDLLEAYRIAGVNRVSFGAEILDDDGLVALGRIHRSDDVAHAVGWSRSAGFDNVNLDLIYGLPGQTVHGWLRTLTDAADWNPDHLSAYSLQLEPGTRLTHDVAAGRSILPPEEDVLAMEFEGIGILSSRGYERYEVSNFARPGKRCRHNLLYWRHENVRGFGSSAHSFLDGRHTTNIPKPEAYIDRIQKNLPAAEIEEQLDASSCTREAAAFGLRLTEGIDLQSLRERYGAATAPDLDERLARLEQEGLVTAASSRVRLTPRGVRFADTVGMALM
jgi:oxygen-independent coproporphyrinogen III oxidase